MGKKVRILGFIVLLIIASSSLLLGESKNITEGLSTTAEGSLQDSETINKYNYALNKEIIRLYKTLEGYNKLYVLFQPKFEDKDGKCIEIKKSYEKMSKTEKSKDEYFRRVTRIPQQTILRWIRVKDTEDQKGGSKCDVVGMELENYGFVYPKEKVGWGEPVGSTFRKVRLFFKNDKLVKIKSSIGIRDFKNHTTKNFYITDKDVLVDYKDDETANKSIGEIHFKYVNTHKVGYEKLIKEMSNVISNPNQVLFKKRFYVRHLEHFENLYRKTMDYQKDLLEDLDKNLIKEMESTLDF